MPSDTGEMFIPTEELGAPARRALEGVGYTTLGPLAEVGEAAVGDLHAVGPSALKALRTAFATNGPSFEEDGEPP